jgi:hypothetical protein
MLSAVDLQGPYQSFEAPSDFPRVNQVLHKPVKGEELLRYVANALGEKK